jgi:hypothetical protein
LKKGEAALPFRADPGSGNGCFGGISPTVHVRLCANRLVVSVRSFKQKEPHRGKESKKEKESESESEEEKVI